MGGRREAKIKYGPPETNVVSALCLGLVLERGTAHLIFSSHRTALCRQNLQAGPGTRTGTIPHPAPRHHLLCPQARSSCPAEPSAGRGPGRRVVERTHRHTNGNRPDPAVQSQGGAGQRADTPPGRRARRGETRVQPFRAQTPEFPDAGSAPREGNAVRLAGSGGRRVRAGAGGSRGEGGWGRPRAWLRERVRREERAVSSGVPGAGRPRAPHGGLTRAGASRGRDGAADPHQVPATRRPPDSDGFQRSNPQLPHGHPLGPFPPSASVRERKKERAAAAARGPTHHDPRRRRSDPGGRCAVQGSRRPLPALPGAALLPTHTHVQRTHAAPAPPRPLGLAPLQRGAPSRRAVSGARRSPPPPLAGASPAASRGGWGGAGLAGRPLGAASRAPS